MKFSYGKKYLKKKIEVEKINDPKVLHVLLYNCERNWSYAMDLKQGYSNQGKLKEVANIYNYNIFFQIF